MLSDEARAEVRAAIIAEMESCVRTLKSKEAEPYQIEPRMVNLLRALTVVDSTE